MILVCSLIVTIPRSGPALGSSIMQLKSIFIDNSQFAPVTFSRYEPFDATSDACRNHPGLLRDRENYFQGLESTPQSVDFPPIRCSFRGLCKYLIEFSKQNRVWRDVTASVADRVPCRILRER